MGIASAVASTYPYGKPPVLSITCVRDGPLAVHCASYRIGRSEVHSLMRLTTRTRRAGEAHGLQLRAKFFPIVIPEMRLAVNTRPDACFSMIHKKPPSWSAMLREGKVAVLEGVDIYVLANICVHGAYARSV